MVWKNRARMGAVTVFCGVSLACMAEGVLAEPAPPATRTVAVTIDDLPGAPAALVANDPATVVATNRKLVQALRADGVPAVGFVNEGKLDVVGEDAAARTARVDALRLWIDAGLELGNHTYSHRSLNRTPLEEFEADVVRGEPVLRELLAPKGKPLRYFRHPFLQVGLELDKRRAFERYLAERGYTIAPVTIDNDEYMFAAIYAAALRRGDGASAEKVAAAYLDYMEEVFAFVEETSRRLFDREPAQVLLIHVNALNADRFGDLAARMTARGYRFVPLEAALADPAYASPDDYVGAWGISWLHHWELTAGRKRSPSPEPPVWITEGWDALSR
jgi:peptidoglycan/xylan/chitin deacetylase (PgdA/CDA1 family)